VNRFGYLSSYRPAVVAGVLAAAGGLWAPTLLLEAGEVVGPVRDYVALTYMAVGVVLVVVPAGVGCGGWQGRARGRERALGAGLIGLAAGVAAFFLLGVPKALFAPGGNIVFRLGMLAFETAVIALLLSIPFTLGWGLGKATLSHRQPEDALPVRRCQGCGAELYGPWFDRKKGGYVCRRCGVLTMTGDSPIGPSTVPSSS